MAGPTGDVTRTHHVALWIEDIDASSTVYARRPSGRAGAAEEVAAAIAFLAGDDASCVPMDGSYRAA